MEIFKMPKTGKNGAIGPIFASMDASTGVNNRIKNRNTALNQFWKNELCWKSVSEFKYILKKLIGKVENVENG